MQEIITLDYGSGGKKTSQLIENLLLPALGNPALNDLGDGAILSGSGGGELVFSTDSFVVSPRFFPGGDIGKLSVCGTVNDIAVSGGEAKYLSLAFILEEGLPMEELERILASIRRTAEEAGVQIVTGDTKVVERGRGDGIYINTAGIGILRYPGLGKTAIREGDKVLVSGYVGDHGTAVMLSRNPALGESPVVSDCAVLSGLCRHLLESCEAGEVRILRDPTRGGVATTLNEFVENGPYSIELEEAALPIRPAVRSACDLLGLDPLYCANEGKILAVVAAETAEKALLAMKERPEGRDAAIIGTVKCQHPGKVVIKTAFGGTRIAAKLSGAQLPRIC